MWIFRPSKLHRKKYVETTRIFRLAKLHRKSTWKWRGNSSRFGLCRIDVISTLNRRRFDLVYPFLDIQAIIEWRFTLKRVPDMIITYSLVHNTFFNGKYYVLIMNYESTLALGFVPSLECMCYWYRIFLPVNTLSIGIMSCKNTSSI